MLCGGVAACHGYGVFTVRCVECDCRTQLFAVLSATQVALNTANSTKPKAKFKQNRKKTKKTVTTQLQQNTSQNYRTSNRGLNMGPRKS